MNTERFQRNVRGHLRYFHRQSQRRVHVSKFGQRLVQVASRDPTGKGRIRRDDGRVGIHDAELTLNLCCQVCRYGLTDDSGGRSIKIQREGKVALCPFAITRTRGVVERRVKLAVTIQVPKNSNALSGSESMVSALRLVVQKKTKNDGCSLCRELVTTEAQWAPTWLGILKPKPR